MCEAAVPGPGPGPEPGPELQSGPAAAPSWPGARRGGPAAGTGKAAGQTYHCCSRSHRAIKHLQWRKYVID